VRIIRKEDKMQSPGAHSIQQKLLNLFDKYDKDKNGVLSISEIAEIMKTVKKGKAPTAEEVSTCFHNMDANHNGVIEKEEFMRALMDWLDDYEQTKLSPAVSASPRIREKRHLLDGAPESTAQKQKLSHIMEYFHSFHSKSDISEFEEEQRRFYSKPREESNCPNLLFGLQELSVADKHEVIAKIISIINVDNFFVKIRGAPLVCIVSTLFLLMCV
jgi:hypothetical protein